MNKRENLLSLCRRQGYQKVPVEFSMCPQLQERFDQYVRQYEPDLDYSPWMACVCDLTPQKIPEEKFRAYYDVDFKEGTVIDEFGIAHEPGSAAAFHMTKMYHPMENFDSVEQVQAYPFLDYSAASGEEQAKQAEQIKRDGMAAIGMMQMTIWELSWYLRGMENLMMDMMSDDPIAEAILDRVTENAVLRAESYARSGVDILYVGDDIGMQKTIMMSESLYCDWLKPRLKKVIDRAKAINPDLLVFYHSCGFVEPFIPHLMEIGVDVLNPVQPECMNFREIHDAYGQVLSFHGTIGTQTTMPFGTPDEVRREVFTNLDIAGEKGGLMVAPTHLLEPEVPVENVIAYIKACQEYR